MNNIFKIALCTALLGVTGCSYTTSTHRSSGYNPGYRTNYVAPAPRYVAPPPRYVAPPRYYDSRNHRGYHRDYHGHRRW